MISFFIPIRKNSKRIKNKNIKKIGRNKFGLTEIKFQIYRTFEFSPRSESSIRESYVFRRSTCAGHNVKDANGCDMLRCGCEMRMGVRVAAGARCAGRNVKE